MFVFVYGTLKRGEPNHHWLTNEDQGHARFVCEGKTERLFPLIIASRYNIPFLLDSPGVGNNIKGEVYEIDDKMLANLDILEEYPKLYTRRSETIFPVDGSQELQAITYFLSDFQPDLLQKPKLSCYSSSDPNFLPYVARYVRDKNVDHRPEVKVYA